MRCTSTKRLIIAHQLAWRIRRTDTVNTSSNILVSTGLNSVLASINVNMVRLQELYLGIMSCKSMDLFKNVDHKSWLLNICFGLWTTNPDSVCIVDHEGTNLTFLESGFVIMIRDECMDLRKESMFLQISYDCCILSKYTTSYVHGLINSLANLFIYWTLFWKLKYCRCRLMGSQ